MDETHQWGDQKITPGLISMAEARIISIELIDKDLRFADWPPQQLISFACDVVKAISGKGGASKNCWNVEGFCGAGNPDGDIPFLERLKHWNIKIERYDLK